MDLSKYIACICEGAAEQTIIELLLDNQRLIFQRENLLEEEVLRCRSAKNFETQYLRKGFDEGITVLRILDSHSEKFKLSKAYEHKIRVINVVTAPEIEMLVIIKDGKYADYKHRHSNVKPSDYCKINLGYSNVKSAKFLLNCFRDVDALTEVIREYKRVTNVLPGELALADLLK